MRRLQPYIVAACIALVLTIALGVLGALMGSKAPTRPPIEFHGDVVLVGDLAVPSEVFFQNYEEGCDEFVAVTAYAVGECMIGSEGPFLGCWNYQCKLYGATENCNVRIHDDNHGSDAWPNECMDDVTMIVCDFDPSDPYLYIRLCDATN